MLGTAAVVRVHTYKKALTSALHLPGVFCTVGTSGGCPFLFGQDTNITIMPCRFNNDTKVCGWMINIDLLCIGLAQEMLHVQQTYSKNHPVQWTQHEMGMFSQHCSEGQLAL